MEIFIIILGFIIDRVTKIWAMGIKAKEGIVIVDNFFKFEYLENTGAAFGILKEKIIFLGIFTFIIMGAIIYYLIKFNPKSKVVRISLALIISGALGNLYDRIAYKHVVDFICIHYKEVYYFPTFNVADIMVVIGTILLSIFIIKDGK